LFFSICTLYPETLTITRFEAWLLKESFSSVIYTIHMLLLYLYYYYGVTKCFGTRRRPDFAMVFNTRKLGEVGGVSAAVRLVSQK